MKSTTTTISKAVSAETPSRSSELSPFSSRPTRHSHVSIASHKRTSMHETNQIKQGMFRRAVPQMPRALAYLCFVLNLIFPGTGTLISAFSVFCCGKHGYEKNIVACFYNLLAAILQSATIILLLGWIWSVRWGILFIQLSGKKKAGTTQPTPFYVRRQSSVDTHTQPFLTHMVAPRVPPVLEAKNEFEGV